MKLAFLLSKENIELAKEEVLALTDSEKYQLTDNILILDADKNIDELSNRLAYTHKIYKFLFSVKENELKNELKSFDWQKIYKKDFCLRIPNFANIEPDYAKYIWNKIKNPRVDLTKPKTLIEIFIAKNKAICCLFLSETDKSCLKRKAHLRPALFPSATCPKLTKAGINLTGIKKGETLFDPFAGIGTTLIEARLMGLNPVGYDIEDKFIRMAKMNLNYYKLKSKIEKRDALKINKPYEYVFTDLPYGKNTKDTDLGKLYLNFLKNSYKKIKKRMVIIFPSFVNHKNIIKKTKWKIKNEFNIYIHKSLSKNMVVLEKNSIK